MKITVIGEANIDIAVTRQASMNPSGCIPGAIRFHFGGVARNIAHNLCLLGHEVRLMTVFGNDGFAEHLMADCQQIGIDLSLSTQFDNLKSPIFLSFNDKEGNMESAVSDIALNKRMDINWLKSHMDAINSSNIVVADTLLSSEALAHLIDHCEIPLYIDTVSPGRAIQLSEAMERSEKHSLFALKCNLAEAEAITGESDVMVASKKLNLKGIQHVYITIGANGVIHCSEGVATPFPAIPTNIVNVTGSGDAFFAGIIHANAIGIHGEKAVPFGLKAAQHNIKSEAPVNPTLRLSVFDD